LVVAALLLMQGLESLLQASSGSLRRPPSAGGVWGRDENASPERRGPFLLPSSRPTVNAAEEASRHRKLLAEGSNPLHLGSSDGGATIAGGGTAVAAAAGGGGGGGVHSGHSGLPFSVAYPSSVAVAAGGGGLHSGGSVYGSDW
jgi:hypothetical protein